MDEDDFSQVEWARTVARWRGAGTLAEQGCLVVDWLLGRHPYTPFHLGPPDEETTPLLPVLASLNQSGLVTTCSQPGMDEDGWRQRAFVDCYGYPERIDSLGRVALDAGLWIWTDCSLLSHSDALEPVSEEDGRAVTRCGPFSKEDVFPEWWMILGLSGQDTYRFSRRLCVVDPVWGREDALWSAVRGWARVDPLARDDLALP